MSTKQTTRLNITSIKERLATCSKVGGGVGLLTQGEINFVLGCINKATAPATAVEMHQTRNYMGRIEALWAILSIDDGGEGLCAAPFGGMTLPLIAADKQRLEQIIPVAKRLATLFGKPVRLSKFTKREDVEIYNPN